MTNTLQCTDVLTRVGHTIIDGEKIVQYTCTIPLNDPANMRITSTRLDPNLYKEHRELCRHDLAIFEDSAYELQERYIASSQM